jgi:LuxR family maltose regulon positive regulatory protein
MGKMSRPQAGRQPGGESSELLRTKLTPPGLRGPLVEREALFARLDAGWRQRVVLLSAPAGTGKTTLVRAWLASRAEQSDLPPVGWVSLDAGENDPVRFWRYVLTACAVFQPEASRQALVLLERPRQSRFEGVLTLFLNQMAQVQDHGLLVLEDYHAITSPLVHETLTFLLDHLPETLHVVLVTRRDPPLPLARWRAHHDLCELRAADLRFSLEETQQFLQQAVSFPLAPEMSQRVDERVEGWAAGLRLLALALQGHRTPREVEQVLTTFSGSHQHILEYLVTDVLNAQPPSLQSFLLQTSLLNRLTGSLCDALTGRQDSAQVLAQLDQANLFLYPLDGAGQWYRYHALFAEAMQHEARRRLGEVCWEDLYGKASRWYQEHGQPLEAIEAALAGRDFARAADLMEKLSDPRMFQNEYYTVIRLADQLPEEQLQTRPSLCVVYATGLLYLNDRRAPATLALIERPLGIAERIWRAEGNTAGLGEILALRSSAHWWRGDFAESFRLARRALELLPADSFVWRGSCLIDLSIAELFAGRLDQARQRLQEARQANEIAGNSYATRATQFMLCEIYQRRGELRLAEQMYQHLLIEAEAVQDFPDIGAAKVWQADLAYERNELEVAYERAVQALKTFRRYSDDDLHVHATLVLARIHHARGETAQALQELTSLAAQVQRWPHLLHDIHVCQARLALRAGDLIVAAQQMANATAHSLGDHFFHQQDLALLNARLLLAQDQMDEALGLLLTWQVEAQERGLTRSLLEILNLQALVHSLRKEGSQARQALRQALTLARPEGYQRLFLDEGPLLGDLLRTVLPEVRDEQLESYIRELLRAFAREQAAASGTKPAQPAEPLLIEPLSPQERRVLRLLAAGRSNPEIASELIVSVNTIKTQVQSIYYKLGVNSRQEAREAARKLGLV